MAYKITTDAAVYHCLGVEVEADADTYENLVTDESLRLEWLNVHLVDIIRDGKVIESQRVKTRDVQIDYVEHTVEVTLEDSND
ncbi:hypothetical protein [Nesterenkonia rhizosphaerae]|uniref:Uncharacterized protein n=1 Tax=Nesterenkonia rhizosphaerae TaxID=1348272 RepID=A0ABP9FSU3_9MICC